MAVYIPDEFLLPNGLDELGLELGLQRFSGESLSDYRRRLVLESRERSGASQDEFIISLNRKVGLFDQPIFEIDLILDVDGNPVASDPYIQITSTWLRVYSDFANLVLDFEVNLVENPTAPSAVFLSPPPVPTAYFLNDIQDAFTGSAFFTLTVIPDGTAWEFLRSDHLRYGSSNRIVMAEGLRESNENRLQRNLVRSLRAQAFQVFQNEVSDPTLVVASGDFHIDYRNGVIFTYDLASGFVSYEYRQFPYTLYWQSVRAYPYNDADIDYLHKNTLIDDATGLPVYELLNSEGARISNLVQVVHPLGWGK